jgi:hypothetical protein
MLLVNLTEELVNGKIGKVSNIIGGEIFVDYNSKFFKNCSNIKIFV